MANREVIGIVTKINDPDAHVERSADWLGWPDAKKSFMWIPRSRKEYRSFWNISGKKGMLCPGKGERRRKTRPFEL